MNTGMIWNTISVHHRKKSYHAVKGSFGLSCESLKDWKMCEDLCQSLELCMVQHEVCRGETLLCRVCASGWRGRKEERKIWFYHVVLYDILIMLPSGH